MEVVEISSGASPYLNYKQSSELILDRVTLPFAFLMIPQPLSYAIEPKNSDASYSQRYFPGEKDALIDSVMGKYAHVQTSSESFAIRKRKDIEME